MANTQNNTVQVEKNVFESIKKALTEKKEWVKKVQSGEVTYTKGKRIA
mgnify:CR=1 FL=1|tara:strand:- start:443 stop:586 length:144 start_codon:yes stop_codon:yes gene_type:complete